METVYGRYEDYLFWKFWEILVKCIKLAFYWGRFTLIFPNIFSLAIFKDTYGGIEAISIYFI